MPTTPPVSVSTARGAARAVHGARVPPRSLPPALRVAAVGLALAMAAAAGATAAEPVRTAREVVPIDEAVWSRLRDTMALGCRFSPPEPARGDPLAPAALDRACGCMARRFAERAKASEPFHAALRADDRGAIGQLARAFVIEPDGRRSFTACADDEAGLATRIGRLLGR
jgi:hypothetical protein